MHDKPSLPLEKALNLVGLADGLLRVPGLTALSLPCVVEKRENPARHVLVTHFERARETYVSALRATPPVTVHFVVGFHYIDPSWIARSPHAPTEVKAVFEISGKATLVDRAHADTLAMMETVTRAKQSLYSPGSDWRISALPESYVSRLFPMICELEIEIEQYELSRLMVLDHLSTEHREHVISMLRDSDNPSSRAALRLFATAYGA
jgi:predicted FMN-binding regulatory protein PaiB